MGEWIFSCWSCGHKTPLQDRVRRKEYCSACLSDMHTCRNCRFFSPYAHNQCAEPIAEQVPDKERSNFCGLYQAKPDPSLEAADVQRAKDKLEALFAKP